MTEPAQDENKSKGKREGYDRPPPFGLFALIVIALLVVGGWLLIQHLGESSRLEDCVNAGRKNCAPIDTSNMK